MATAVTEQEKAKAKALVALEERRAKNKNIARVNNSRLPAGSPMYYYCRSCSAEMVLAEDHPGPAPRLCSPCRELEAHGWLEQ